MGFKSVKLEVLEGDVKFITREDAEQALPELSFSPVRVHLGGLNMEIRKATGKKSGKKYVGVFNQSGDFLGFAKPEYLIKSDGSTDRRKILGFDVSLKHLGVPISAVKNNSFVLNGIPLTLADTVSVKTGATYTGVYDVNGDRKGIAWETRGGQLIVSLNVYAQC